MNTFNADNRTVLDAWLKRATCGLASTSAAQVRTEIQEHYESAYEEAVEGGVAPHEAARRAVASLGDPKTANRDYRKVLLTSSEARLLRETKWEAQVVCSRLRWLLPIPAAGLFAAIWFLAMGETYIGSLLLAGVAGLGFILGSPFLPIYTPRRARVFRGVRWAWLAAVLLWAAWPDFLKESWLLIACGWPIAWVEWTLFSVRRKLPVAEWPKQLYL